MRVVIAEDQRVVREGLVTILETFPGVEVVAAVGDGAAALDAVAALSPDVALLDLRMPVLDGVEAARRITASHPSTRVVVLTTYADDQSVLSALGAGACGYLTKDAGAADIRRALEAAAAGQSVLDAGVQAVLVHAAGGRAPAPVAPPDGLTAREAEVLGLIAQGLSNAEIGARLFVGEATVKTHVNRIFAKTGCRDRAQAVAYAHRHGLTR